MKMVPDRTGRFAARPYYDAAELDADCEQVVLSFLEQRHGTPRFPLETDELTVLIEQSASLDSSVDLTRHGAEVEGMTVFRRDQEPEVCISDRLSAPYLENRLRSTLAHEYGHVRYHGPLWAEKFSAGLFDRETVGRVICRRDNIIDITQTDWMEWQAAYVSGAVLMPARTTRRKVGELCQSFGWHAAIVFPSDRADAVIAMVTDAFQVSADAARVRLQQLGILRPDDGQLPLL